MNVFKLLIQRFVEHFGTMPCKCESAECMVVYLGMSSHSGVTSTYVKTRTSFIKAFFSASTYTLVTRRCVRGRDRDFLEEGLLRPGCLDVRREFNMDAPYYK